MTTEHRDDAAQRLRELLALLRAQAGLPRLDEVIALAEHLQKAIATFHMEAIRFRMFTLGRVLSQLDRDVPAPIHEKFDAVRTALEAAGFHTRSVGH